VVFSRHRERAFSTFAFIMKPKRTRSKKPAVIANSRWLAYATAGAASAFTCTSSEASIHYSGRIAELFFSSCTRSVQSARFQLDQPGDSFRLRHTPGISCAVSYGGFGHFGVTGLADAGFAGFYCPNFSQFGFVSKLNRGQLISSRTFLARNSGLFAGLSDTNCPEFEYGDLGFIGFKFNNGSGDQYGWVRIKMGSRYPIDNDFWLVDYAYADPGEPIKAGQTSSNDVVPIEGSLSGLALGAAGLLAWRKRRSRAVR
jgi:hypothetical protein